MSPAARTALAAALAALAAGPGRAEPYRLRSNAFALLAADAPAGLLVLDADDDLRPWLAAEAVVWIGGAEDDAEADAMVISVIARDPERGEAQVGRFLVVPGAVRPLHVDGARLRAELPADFSVEVFGGVPVVPELGVRSGDWLAGGRAARKLGDWGSAGLAYLHERRGGDLTDHEVGVDGGASFGRYDVGGRLAFDLIDPGVSDAMFSASARRGPWRWELFASHRSPSRLLPATSLFTVLGDIASQRAGATARWRAAPRLELTAVAAVRRFDDQYRPELIGRGLLRLDERGARAASLELRRDGAPDGGWTGARAGLRLPLDSRLTCAAELELVAADDPAGRGALWPWALTSLAWRFTGAWEAAVAVEASASPEHTHRVDGVARLTHRWDGP